jgi:hypothetical protein
MNLILLIIDPETLYCSHLKLKARAYIISNWCIKCTNVLDWTTGPFHGGMHGATARCTGEPGSGLASPSMLGTEFI